MPNDSGTPRACAQPILPDDMAGPIESTFAVLTDPNAPAWTKHHALLQLAEAAFMVGKATQAAVDFRALQAMTGDRAPVEPTGLRVVR